MSAQSDKWRLPPEWSRGILDSIGEGLFIVDRDFRITWFNRAAEEITGVPREEALGSFCFEVLRTEACETSCPMRGTMKTGETLSGRRFHILKADGSRLPVEVKTVPLRSPEGELEGGVVTFRDLSFEEALKEAARAEDRLCGMVGTSPAMKKIFTLVSRMALSEATVLIQGESGTGKELVARALHDLGPRNKGPFVALNLAALPETLVEAELFGYEPGAFTGARGRREGALGRAAGGTLFLDEAGEIPLPLQPKLLRFLEDHTFTPLGGKSPRRVDVRILAATNRDLKRLAKEGLFREDLFYRLAVLVLEIPPLRERPQDIPPLAEHFLETLSRRRAKKTAGWSPQAMDHLMRYTWPGNVRELQNAVETALLFCPEGSPILPEHLPPEVRREREVFLPGQESPRAAGPLTLKEIEATAIMKALERNKGNKGKTAWELGIHRVTLYRKLKELGLMKRKRRKDSKDSSIAPESEEE